jgi:hypothetical protein
VHDNLISLNLLITSPLFHHSKLIIDFTRKYFLSGESSVYLVLNGAVFADWEVEECCSAVLLGFWALGVELEEEGDGGVA